MSKSVLVVDDTTFMRTKLKTILEGIGLTVIGEAADGVQAVEQYKKLKPDIVTLDITMPVMDGMGALSEIMKYDLKAKVVMVSALGHEEYIVQAIKSGARNFIIKPFKDEKVKEVISAL